MAFEIDYSKLVSLDAEELAETGIEEAYEQLLPSLHEYVSNPNHIKEVINSDAPRYAVIHNDKEYIIYSPEIDEDELQSWGRATFAFFAIVNLQLTQNDHRFYAFDNGNDLGGMFLTHEEADAAKRSLPRKTDWPYLPTLEHPWYGQHH